MEVEGDEHVKHIIHVVCETNVHVQFLHVDLNVII